jgi:purine-binding chemotaxis protein CheW
MAESMLVGLGQSLTFTLGSETFAVEVNHVREILEAVPMTRMPDSPAYIGGIINVRGAVVPVVDLRVKLGMERMKADGDTAIIVTERRDPHGTVSVVGLLVDAVQEVIEFEDTTVEPPPSIGHGIKEGVLHGIGRRNGRFILLLNIDRLLRDTDG